MTQSKTRPPTPLLAVLLGAAASMPAQAAGGDKASAERDLQTLVQTCAACHGENGDQALQPSYPLLAGQHASYLESALKQYRSGARNNAVMNGQAANLTDGEIRALARYFSGKQSALHTPAYAGE